MENKINEEVLCILRYKDDEIIIDYEPIEKNFVSELDALKKLCETSSDNLLRIIEYINRTINFKALEKYYKYCVKLDGSYQGFEANLDTPPAILSVPPIEKLRCPEFVTQDLQTIHLQKIQFY